MEKMTIKFWSKNHLWLVKIDEYILESPIVEEKGESGIARGARKSGVARKKSMKKIRGWKKTFPRRSRIQR